MHRYQRNLPPEQDTCPTAAIEFIGGFQDPHGKFLGNIIGMQIRLQTADSLQLIIYSKINDVS